MLSGRCQEEAAIRDLIDIHRANIAKAGVALAEAVAEATTIYTLAIAASETELEVQMERRVAAFHGGTEVAAPAEPEKPDRSPTADLFIKGAFDDNIIAEMGQPKNTDVEQVDGLGRF